MRAFERQGRAAAVNDEAFGVDEAVLDEDGGVGAQGVDEAVMDFDR